MRGPSNALGQVESSDAHDGHVTRLVSLRSAGLCKCLGSESATRTRHAPGRRMDTRILFGYLASPVFRIRILAPACIQYSDTVCGYLTPSPYMLAPWGLSRLSLSPGARARHTDTRGAARLHKSGSRLPAVPDMTPPLSGNAQSHSMARSSE